MSLHASHAAVCISWAPAKYVNMTVYCGYVSLSASPNEQMQPVNPVPIPLIRCIPSAGKENDDENPYFGSPAVTYESVE